MINLMHVNDYIIDTSKFRPLLHDKIVDEFEQNKIYKRLEKKILGRNK